MTEPFQCPKCLASYRRRTKRRRQQTEASVTARHQASIPATAKAAGNCLSLAPLPNRHSRGNRSGHIHAPHSRPRKPVNTLH